MILKALILINILLAYTTVLEFSTNYLNFFILTFFCMQKRISAYSCNLINGPLPKFMLFINILI